MLVSLIRANNQWIPACDLYRWDHPQVSRFFLPFGCKQTLETDWELLVVTCLKVIVLHFSRQTIKHPKGYDFNNFTKESVSFFCKRLKTTSPSHAPNKKKTKLELQAVINGGQAPLCDSDPMHRRAHRSWPQRMMGSGQKWGHRPMSEPWYSL